MIIIRQKAFSELEEKKSNKKKKLKKAAIITTAVAVPIASYAIGHKFGNKKGLKQGLEKGLKKGTDTGIKRGKKEMFEKIEAAQNYVNSYKPNNADEVISAATEGGNKVRISRSIKHPEDPKKRDSVRKTS